MPRKSRKTICRICGYAPCACAMFAPLRAEHTAFLEALAASAAEQERWWTAFLGGAWPIERLLWEPAPPEDGRPPKTSA